MDKPLYYSNRTTDELLTALSNLVDASRHTEMAEQLGYYAKMVFSICRELRRRGVDLNEGSRS